MVRLWDDLIALCARVGLRVLLTPFDTFWHWRRWHRHPYNRRHGGPCDSRTRFLVCSATRELVVRRLAFASERWGASGVIFGWDLWNELHPAQAGGDHRAIETMHDFVHEVGDALRALELRVHGRAHPQTASVFGPELRGRPDFRALVFRHPTLDFASTHFYAERTIDHPRDTVAPAVAAGLLVEQALAEIVDARPFLDSEHGPIHTFKDRRRTLSEAFDDEYHRHFQWAHLASGGAGGGMRWPNRSPHVLTPGMRAAQGALARFLPLVDWPRFRRRPLSRAVVLRDAAGGDPLPLVVPGTPPGADGPPVVALGGAAAAAFACGDDAQAVAYLLRSDALAADGRVRTDVAPRAVTLEVPGLAPGAYRVTRWCPVRGAALHEARLEHAGGALHVPDLPLVGDLALAVRRVT
jgi:mannan endo-1,4-beta-mannosidase